MKKIFLLVFLFSCAHSHHQSTTDIIATPQSLHSTEFSNKIITSESHQLVILWLSFSTDYVQEAVSKIEHLCPHGAITPLTTTYTTDLGFLSWTNRIKLTGNCLTKK